MPASRHPPPTTGFLPARTHTVPVHDAGRHLPLQLFPVWLSELRGHVRLDRYVFVFAHKGGEGRAARGVGREEGSVEWVGLQGLVALTFQCILASKVMPFLI